MKTSGPTLRGATLDKLAELVSGDAKLCPYRSGPMLVRLFNAHGSNDVYGQGFPSRQTYARERLHALNGKPELHALLEQVFDPLEFEGKEGCEHGPIIVEINKFLQRDQLQLVTTPQGVRLRPVSGANVVFASPSVVQPASQEFIDEHIAKCEAKLRQGDFPGAITNARSLCEEVLCAIEKQIDPAAPNYDGDLGKLFKRVRKHLNMEPERFKERDDVLQLLRGLTSIVDGLASMSNDLGDRHGGSGVKPKPHHAALAVNSANTLCSFILSSFALQRVASPPKV
jgi:hypothetical protein